MAKQSGPGAAQVCKTLCDEVKAGIFKPVYLLMGDEAYYPDILCKTILDNCIDESLKDFNETVCYGSDVDADQIITAAKRYPMMSERQLVVVREAQLVKDIENLAAYCAEPLDSTVLVLLFHKASPDKRKALYKAIQKNGAILDSPAIRDYEITRWIIDYYTSRGLRIDAEGAALLGESAGTELSVIVAETDKLLKNLPEGTVNISSGDIERNVGISRQYSIFELTKALSGRDSRRALELASRIGDGAKFAMPMAVSALYTHFYKLLKYQALLLKNPRPSDQQKSAVLGGSPYFFREYDTAARNYSIRTSAAIISLLCEYDYLGKGGDGAATSQGELLVELTAKILAL